MTSEQFKQRRLKMGYKTQQQMAEVLGITQGSVAHYETGRRPVPEIVVRFMRCIEDNRKGVMG